MGQVVKLSPQGKAPGGKAPDPRSALRAVPQPRTFSLSFTLPESMQPKHLYVVGGAVVAVLILLFSLWSTVGRGGRAPISEDQRFHGGGLDDSGGDRPAPIGRESAAPADRPTPELRRTPIGP